MSGLNKPIFPIVTFNPEEEVWNCMGTGYFINPVGAFITAKHLLFIEGKQTEKTLYAIQNIDDKEYHVRPVKQIVPHENADIMIGLLGPRRIETENHPAVPNKYFALDLEPLNTSDKISTFAFPKTEKMELENGETEFTFTGKYSEGEIIDFHQNGTSRVRNRCYQTNMRIESGASGGPVLKNGYIVGVNSSSFELPIDDEPISFITPVDYILDLEVKENSKLISVKSLINNHYIKTKNKYG